jgi:nucleotide-binding universal stress UspA family protein
VSANSVGHVVVPADSSPASLQGLALAADVARRTGARVTVVHIRHVPAGANLSPGSIGGPVVETLNEMEAEARSRRRGAGRARRQLGVRRWSGSPGEHVLEAVKEVGGNLVIIGSKRHSSVHNVLLSWR